MVNGELNASTSKKKRPLFTELKVLMVEHIENNWHQIEAELGRWRDILANPWNRFKEKTVTATT